GCQGTLLAAPLREPHKPLGSAALILSLRHSVFQLRIREVDLLLASKADPDRRLFQTGTGGKHPLARCPDFVSFQAGARGALLPKVVSKRKPLKRNESPLPSPVQPGADAGKKARRRLGGHVVVPKPPAHELRGAHPRIGVEEYERRS